MIKKLIATFFISMFLIPLANAQEPPFLKYTNSAWVDSVMTTLTPDERIAQLIMVAAYSNRGPEHKQEILKLIEEQKIGGL
ncbi:MAG TPA: glycoside hydrolase family 3, partial [Salinimicrobium sp.]|nr:glycoside hydrolase family 3 [Salinimicrobium sp.]